MISTSKKKSSARCCALLKRKKKKLNLQNNSITSRLIYIFSYYLFILNKNKYKNRLAAEQIFNCIKRIAHSQCDFFLLLFLFVSLFHFYKPLFFLTFLPSRKSLNNIFIIFTGRNKIKTELTEIRIEFFWFFFFIFIN